MEKIVAGVDGRTISPYFGRSKQFLVFDVEDGKIVKEETFENPGHTLISSPPKFVAKLGAVALAVKLDPYLPLAFLGIGICRIEVVERNDRVRRKCTESRVVGADPGEAQAANELRYGIDVDRDLSRPSPALSLVHL